MSQINGELSDLFFNHRNDNYDALFNTKKNLKTFEGPSQEDIETAILKDAEDFAKCYPETMRFFGNPEPIELASDFLKRL